MYGIAFDLEKTPAERIDSQAYTTIKLALTKNAPQLHFKWKQGSVYITTKGLDIVHLAIERLRALPFHQYFKDLRVFECQEGHDFTQIVTH